MKRHLITAAVCLLVALVPVCLIAISASKNGLIPESLEKYSDSVTVRTPDGSEFTYSHEASQLALLVSAVETATPSEREIAELASNEYRRFDLTFGGKRKLSLSAYVSCDPPCAFLATSGDKYYRIDGEELLRLFKAEFFACLWVGDAPPAASLKGSVLETSIVEWS